jgi:hypothetical protein
MSTNGQQEIGYVITAVQMGLRFTTTMSGVVLKALQATEKTDPVAKALADSFRAGNAYYRIVELGTQDAVRQELERHGITAVSTNYGDQGCVMFQAKDREAADLIIDDYLVQQTMGGLVGDKAAFDHYARSQVMEIKDMDYANAQMFVDRCEQQHIPVMVEGPNNGKCAIRFAERDKDAIDRVSMDVAVMMSSPAHAAIQKQLDWREQNHVAVANAALNQRGFDDKPLATGSVIVDMSGKTLEVNAHTLSLADDVKTVSLSKKRASTRQGQSQVQDFVVGMQEPVLLNPQQAAKYKKLKPEQQRDFLIDIERQQGRPVLSQAEQDALAQTLKQRAAVEQKLEMEHPNTSRAPYTEYNDMQGLVGFKAEEHKAFETAHDLSESAHRDSSILNDAQAENTGVDGGWTEEAKKAYAEQEPEEMEFGLGAEIEADRIFNGQTEVTERGGEEPVMGTPDHDVAHDMDNLDDLGVGND